MIVAIISAKWNQIDSAETLLGFEEVLYMSLFGWLTIAGPGPISLDWLLQRWFGSARPLEPVAKMRGISVAP